MYPNAIPTGVSRVRKWMGRAVFAVVMEGLRTLAYGWPGRHAARSGMPGGGPLLPGAAALGGRGGGTALASGRADENRHRPRAWRRRRPGEVLGVRAAWSP